MKNHSCNPGPGKTEEMDKMKEDFVVSGRMDMERGKDVMRINITSHHKSETENRIKLYVFHFQLRVLLRRGSLGILHLPDFVFIFFSTKGFD